MLAIHRIAEDKRQSLSVKEVMSPGCDSAFPDEDLFTILKRFAAKGVGNLPVVPREQPERPIGLVTRSGLWSALETAKNQRAGVAGAPAAMQSETIFMTQSGPQL